MEITPDKRKLVALVEQAYQGELCLPNFQRDFVWPRNDVADLVRSVLRGYFVGSLLLLRCDPDAPPFAPLHLRGAQPRHVSPRPEFLVLDGQQRLTSLIYALTAPDLPLKDSSRRRWFFVDLNLLLNEPDDDEIVFDRTKKELDGLLDRETQFERGVLPCFELLSSSRFLKWRDGLDDWLRDHDLGAHEEFRESRRDLITSVATEFQDFRVPLVELPAVDESDPHSIGRVCAIFEKLNSTGVELSVYDLLTARLYRHGIRLHDLWDSACAEHPRLNEWSGGKADTNKLGVLVLRTLALLRGLDPKPRILIDLAPDDFANDWRRAAAAMDRALELLTHTGKDGFGVFDRKWLPGFGLTSILAALRARVEDLELGQQARADLRRWYWCNVFLERYSSAVESKSRKDYLELVGYWTEGKPEPAVFAEARSRIGSSGYTLRDSASSASAVYSGVFSLLALRGARDWRRREDIQLQQLHDHHIFPQAFLKRHGITERIRVNSVVNRTLISDETNLLIRDKAPSVYMDDRGVLPSRLAEDLAAPHFLEAEALEWMAEASENLNPQDALACYDGFRNAREATVVRAVREACGVLTSAAENATALGPIR